MSNNMALRSEIQSALRAAERPFNEIAAEQGNLVTWKQESMFALQAIQTNTLLQKCEPSSIRNSIINIASIGLSLNPKLQHCALIPRYDSYRKTYICHADPMYRGLIALAHSDGVITQCRVEIVYERDIEQGNFVYEGGTTPRIMFNPNPFETDRGQPAGAFCIAYIPNDPNPHITTMTWKEILAIRDRSETWKSKLRKEAKGEKGYGGPWESDEHEMARKTVVKRAQKYWPKNLGGVSRLSMAVHLANEAEGYIEPRDTDIEGKAIPLVTPEQAEILRKTAREAHVKVEKIYARFGIAKMEEMPVSNFQPCMDLLRESRLIYVLRNATEDTEVYADEWGITFQQLEGKAANEQSKAKLFATRPKAENEGK